MNTRARLRIVLTKTVLTKTVLASTALAALSTGCGSQAAKPSDSGTTVKQDAYAGPDAPPVMGSVGGFVTYVANGEILRIEARRGATPISISAALRALAPGSKDETPAVSRNGQFITVTSDRFDPDCAGYSCLAIVKGDLSAAEKVRVNNEPVRPKGHAAISNDGKLIVYPADGGPHDADLFAIRKVGSTWGAPLLLTASSTDLFNEQVVISPDESTALFNCGPVPYASNGTGACEVNIDGSGFRKLVDPTQNPLGQPGDFTSKNADYMKDGGLVFEADWSGEQLWRLPPGGGNPSLIFASHGNDNSPCSLPGGYLASLWLGRPEGQGFHELTITAPDGSESFVLTPDVDVLDIDVMCHD